MNVELILESLRQTFPGQPIAARSVPVAETFVTLPPECLYPAVQLLLERFNIYHLSTITGLDNGTEIELFYHFWDGQGLTLHTSVPRKSAVIHSLIGLIPGAAFYEREVTEMLDVMFEWHPMKGRLILPDDWWPGDAPLRKSERHG